MDFLLCLLVTETGSIRPLSKTKINCTYFCHTVDEDKTIRVVLQEHTSILQQPVIKMCVKY